MSQRSQPERVVAFLSAHPRQKFKASDIATGIIAMFPEDYRQKRANPRFANDEDFVKQVLAEIGAHKQSILAASSYIDVQD